MYQGKRDGRGTFRIFRAEMGAALKARAQLESDLRRAIARGEIAPYYQPIVWLPSEAGRLRSAGALESSHPRPDRAGRVHSGRRGNRA